MKLWQGLGYYSRARNLHTTAQFISKNHNGTFPTNYADIRALKGVGSYTAAAIASFAFDLPYAVLDGNVYRVLSRLIGIATPIDSSAGKKQFESVAQELLNSKHPALHNQAIMEFGALQCKPVRPPCESCVLKHVCAAFSSKQVAELPVKAKSVKVRNRHFNYLFLRYKNKTVLNKRIQKDIWIDLYDFPLIETDKQLSEKQFLKSPAWKKFIGETEYTITAVSTPYKHLLSHQKIYARFWELSFKTPLNPLLADSQILIFQKDLSKYPVPRLIETYLEARMLG